MYYGEGINPPQPDKPENSINKIGVIYTGILSGKVDAALIEIDRNCCNCGGVPYEETIDKMSHNGYNGIMGTNKAMPGDSVYMVGKTSGKTAGVVISSTAPCNTTIDTASDDTHPSPGFVNAFTG